MKEGYLGVKEKHGKIEITVCDNQTSAPSFIKHLAHPFTSSSAELHSFTGCSPTQDYTDFQQG